MLYSSSEIKAQWNVIDTNIYYNNGNVAIGHDKPNASLHLFNSKLSNNKIIIENSYTIGLGIDGLQIGVKETDGYINMPQNRTLYLKTYDTPRLTILGNGYIGIGLTNPSANLHLVGGFKYIDGNQGTNKILFSDSNGLSSWQNLNLNLNSDTLSLNSFSYVDLSMYLDNTDKQNLTITNDKLAITNSTDSINLSVYKKLTENEVDNYVNNNGYITTELDGDSLNELITNFEFTGDSLKITDAGGTRGVNLRDLSQNYWTQTSINKLYYNEGNVGIGLNNPSRQFQIHSDIDEGGSIGIGIGGPKGLHGGGSSTPSYYKSTVLLTNLQTGKKWGDGLKLESNNKNGTLRLQEAGELSLTVGNYGIRIKPDGNLKFDKLAGVGERVLITDAQGNIIANTNLSDIANIWQKNGNVAYYNNGYIGIGTNEPSQKLDIEGRLQVRGTDFYLGIDDDGSSNRALVHGNNDELIINYANDFEGGVVIPTKHGISPNHAQLTIKGNGGGGTGDAYISFNKGAESNSIWSVGLRDGGNYFAISNDLLINNNPRFVILEENGNVGIGTITPTNKLTVNGKILAEEIEVIDNVLPDYVFEKEYKLMNLKELENFISINKHLPEIPSAENVKENHLKLGEMNNLLLKKVEELTLYIIDLQKQIDELKEN